MPLATEATFNFQIQYIRHSQWNLGVPDVHDRQHIIQISMVYQILNSIFYVVHTLGQTVYLYSAEQSKVAIWYSCRKVSKQ